MSSAQKHLLIFILKKFVYQAEIHRSTFSDFAQIYLSTNSVYHLIFYRLTKSNKTNADELTLKCKRYYIMIRTLRCLTLLRSYHDRHSPLPMNKLRLFPLANAHYIMEVWNCICKVNVSSTKIFLHLSSYPEHLSEHFLYYPSSFPVMLLPYLFYNHTVYGMGSIHCAY